MATPTNVDGVRPGETDYRPLEHSVLQGLPRDMVARIAANFLAQCFAIEVLHAIVDDGFDKFEAVAREQFHEHNFTRDDYRRIFEVIGTALKDRMMRREGVTLA